MRKHADFLESIVPTPYTVLGLKLRPLCLGHWLLLRRAESPFIFEDTSQTAKHDLLTALLICACSFESGLELLSSPAVLKSELARWNRAMRRLWIFQRSLDLPAAVTLFNQYLTEGLLLPHVYELAGEKVHLGAPWELSLLAKMIESNDLSTAINMPMSLAWFLFHAKEERESRLRILADATNKEDELNLKREAEVREMADAFNLKINGKPIRN